MISAASLEVLILILWMCESLRQIAHQAHAVARIPTGLSARFLLRRPNRRLRGAGLQTGATSDVESRVAAAPFKLAAVTWRGFPGRVICGA
jgi:hypothetical protein